MAAQVDSASTRAPSEPIRQKPSIPPILAYSDSDDDDEALVGNGNQQNKGDTSTDSSTSVIDAKASCGERGPLLHGVCSLLYSSVRTWLSPIDLLKAGAVAIFQAVSPRLAGTFEHLSFLAIMQHPIAKALGHPDFILPHQVQFPLKLCADMYKPVVIQQTLRTALHILKLRRLNYISSTTSDEVFERAETERRTSSTDDIAHQQPNSLPDLAVYYSAELRELKKILLANEVLLPAERFDRNCTELMRYAASCGLLTAKSAHERKLAVSEAALRVMATHKWLKAQRFLGQVELRKWEGLMRWCNNDHSGRMILLVRLGRALHMCHGNKLHQFVNAVVSQVHKGCVAQTRGEGARFDQVSVVVDCRGSNSLTITNHLALLKGVASVFEKHYPNRLYRLYLVEVPIVLRWVLSIMLPVLQPSTRRKVRVCGLGSKEVPVRLAGPDLRQLSSKSGFSPRCTGSLTPFSSDSPLSSAACLLSPVHMKQPKRLHRVSFTPDVNITAESATRSHGDPLSRALSADCAVALGRGGDLGVWSLENEYNFDFKVGSHDTPFASSGAKAAYVGQGVGTQTSIRPEALVRAGPRVDLSSLTPAAMQALYTSLFVLFVLLAAGSHSFFDVVAYGNPM